jgi:hypothetical protein
MAQTVTDQTILARLEAIQHRAFGIGGAALLVCLVGAVISRQEFFRAYLVGYLYWTGIALGCLALLMLYHLVSGRWGFVVQRPLEAAARTLPAMALLFVPLLFGLPDLYVWARPDAVAADHLLQHKQPYLNTPFFVLRAALYFAVWIGLALLLSRWSAVQDRTGDPRLTSYIKRLSGPGLGLYGLTVTFAAVDWVMSLEPLWFSTMYGVIFIVGQGLLALAFAITMGVLLRARPPFAAVVTADRLHDLGNLLLAHVMLWAYIAFSQYLIIWSANLPEETPWYLHRTAGGWKFLALFLVVFHFAVPFLLLLGRTTKRHGPLLLGVAVGLLVMRLLDLFWLVTPALHPEGLRVHWLDILAPLALGGLWVGLFCANLRRRALLPLHDPRFQGIEKAAEGHS